MTKQSPPSEKREKEVAELQVYDVNALKKELEKEREKAEDYLNRLRYLQADFENYRKRVEKQIYETTQYGNRRLILELLPILDELECAVEVGKKSSDKVFLEGVEMTLKKLHSVLEKEGVSEIKAIGESFDPNKHEAVLWVQMEGKDGIVLEEIRKGYVLKDMVIRPSLVKVAVNKSEKR